MDHGGVLLDEPCGIIIKSNFKVKLHIKDMPTFGEKDNLESETVLTFDNNEDCHKHRI